MEEDWNIVLSVLESPDSSVIGRQQVFTASPITIGRADECDFILPDPTISRQHATLKITDDYSRVFIIDQSTHGTAVLGKAVPTGLGSGFTVHDSDTIKVGNTLLRFELKLKESAQATFIGKVDRGFLDKPPETGRPVGENIDEGVDSLSTPVIDEKKSVSPLYIAIIVVCMLILVYLIFLQPQ